MKCHPSTALELKKINKIQQQLKDEGIMDTDSFHEYIKFKKDDQ